MDICWQLPLIVLIALVGGALSQLLADPYRRHHGKH